MNWSAVGAGAVAGAVGGATFGVGTAIVGTGFVATVGMGAVSGVIAGQTGRATENVLEGNAIGAGLGNPADMAQDAVVGGVLGAAGHGVAKGVEAWQGRSAVRLTEAGETFRHYGYAEQAANFEDGLRPGGFAAPSSESIVSGRVALQRYALPPKSSAPNSYYVVEPPPGTAIIGPRRVMPRLWRDGWKPVPRFPNGMEVKFPEGTPPGSVSGPWPLPDQ